VNLSFRIGKIPVRIQPTFLLMAAFLGLYGKDPIATVAWVVVVLVSVLLHELGHATMGRAFGLEPKIELHAMGGTTSWSSPKPLSIPRRIAISLAGPGAGFVVAAVVLAIGKGRFAPVPAGDFVYDDLIFVNFVWGVANLTPMLPLDGGNVLLQLLNAVTKGRGERPARIVSIGFAALTIVAGIVLLGSWWIALLSASFIASNVSGLRDLATREHDAPMRPAIEQAYSALEAKDAARVLALARPVALSAKSSQVRAEALQLVAFGFLLEGRLPDADAAIAALPQGFAPHASLLELRTRVAG
jgi:Zn-dependent protease